MRQYALLVLPAANRVYADTSVRLMRAELTVFAESVLSGDLTDIAEETIGGVDYLTFRASELTDRDVAFLSNLSSLYALFEVSGGWFRPITLTRLDKFDSDLLTIQKYAGKTNELFTKLLCNVTALTAHTPESLLDDRLHVLDPMCGRGTTLNQATMYGFHASGLEALDKDLDEYERFIRTWLKNKRLKHKAESGQIRKNKVKLGRALNIEFAANKDDYRAGEVQKLRFVSGDTMQCGEFFGRGSCDLIVTDAPYGVQHGSRRGTSGAPSRHPVELLADAVPLWSTLLRPGGAIGISWNTYVLRKDDLSAILTKSGLQPRYTEHDFKHRVDQAITRDLIVARKPG